MPGLGASRLFLVLLFLGNFTSAQLVGCDIGAGDDPQDTIICPQTTCIVGNTTNAFLGVTSLESKISPNRPLTWTIGTSVTTSPTVNDTKETFVNSYYLGTPPTLHLANTTAFSGCALFFEGISKNLPLNYTTQYNSVTCNEVLQAGCVTDLLSQATQQVQSLASSPSTTNSTVCQALQSVLETSPPISCPPAVGGSWGNIVARELTGPEAPEAIKLSTCHPTTGGNDYNIALIETESLTAEPVWADPVVSFMFGITPVLTVFYDAGGESALSKPEVHLSCMKVVDDSSGITVPFMGAADKTRYNVWALALALGSVALLL